VKAFRAVLTVVFGLVVLGFIVDDKIAQNAPEQQIEHIKQAQQSLLAVHHFGVPQ